MKIAYSYRRFSQASQEMGHSLRRQADTAKTWCDLNGYTLSNRVFADKGKSAYYGENFKEDGALKQFLDLHAKGEIEQGAVLCIDSTDRFSRLPVNVSAERFLNVVNRGIGIVFTGSYDKRIITGELLAREAYLLQSIIADLKRAHSESEEKSRKVKAALAEKKEDVKAGVVMTYNTVPKYFTFVPEGGVNRRNAKGRYTHNELTPYVKQLVDGILAGKSMYQMAQDFNKRGIPTFKTRREWHRNSIRQILRNRALIGEFLGAKGFLPPIIDETSFLKVQNILNTNKRNRGKRATVTNIFKGMMFCAECGQAFVVASRELKGVEYRYFRCSNYGKNKECKKTHFIAWNVEEEFFRDYLEHNPYSLVNEEDKAELKQIRTEVAQKSARQDSIGKELEGLALMIKDVASIPEFKARIVKLQKERERIKDSIDELNARAAAIEDLKQKDGGLTVQIDDNVYNYETLNQIYAAMNDNTVREKIRVFLPLVIGKIVMDSRTRRFHVYNRTGREVYRSRVHPSKANTTERWKQGIKSWTKRKMANGRVIEVKRYQSPYYKSTLGVPTPALKSKLESRIAK